ncbi:hypothetical protein HNQ59_003952, partial [Chitinivorax tropicus]
MGSRATSPPPTGWGNTQLGVQLAYDAQGQRVAAYSEKDRKREVYGYRADGFLETTHYDGQLQAQRVLDKLGRTLSYLDHHNGKVVHTSYDRDNRTLREVRYDKRDANEQAKHQTSLYFYADPNQAQNPLREANDTQRAAYKGELAKIEVWNDWGSKHADWQNSTLYDYELWDSAKQKNIWISAKNQSGRLGRLQLQYDVNGYIIHNIDQESGRTVRYVNASNGQILQRNVTESLKDSTAPKQYRHWYYYANNQRIGDVATDPEAKLV